MSPSSNPDFATTRWSLVLAAGRTLTADEALESLCRIYWFPLYAYVRRRGHSKEDAEDLTQGFFEDLLERAEWNRLVSERGKFRAFLLAALKHFLANARGKASCQKRGGGAVHLSLDWGNADQQFALVNHGNPEEAFDREWALALLERVVSRLREECHAEGQAERFDLLKPFLSVKKEEHCYAVTADALAMDRGAVRVAVHRLRKRYRQLLREEISHTLSEPVMVDEEMRSLFRAFG